MKIIKRYSDTIPQIERELLLSYVLNCKREELYMNSVSIDEETEKLYETFIKRRLFGEPIQYILGKENFMGIDFIVNKDVFIPRPETEILVSEVLEAIDREVQVKILDLCTGSGNIAVTLAHLIPKSQITAVDISDSSLKVAQKNAILHNVGKRVSFYKKDIFQELLFDKRYIFDIIVSNLPYIKRPDIKSLQKEVRHEPEIALDGGGDGLEFYRRIKDIAPRYLTPKGSLFLEVGFNQAEDVIDIFTSSKLFKIRKIKKDFRGIDRVIWISLL